MKTMMKLLALVMAMMMVLCLAACGGETDPKTTEGSGSSQSTEPTGSTGTSEPDTSKPVDDGKKEYKIILKASNGDPVSNVMVQICKEGATCFTPSRTDENGCAVWRLAEADDYYGTVSSLEEGMPKEYFEGNFEVTLVYDPPVAE